MTLSKDPTSGVWHVRFHTLHGWRQLSTRQVDKAAAERVVALARIKDIEIVGRAGMLRADAVMQVVMGKSLSSQDAFAQWNDHLQATSPSPNTCVRYTTIVRGFLKHLGWPPVALITTRQVDAWVNCVRMLHASTRHVHRSAIWNLFRFCNNNGWCLNVAANVKVKRHKLPHMLKEPKRRRPFTQEEFEKLIAVAKWERMPYWAGFLAIARYTGMRLSDVDQLETDSVTADYITVWTHKRDRRIELPMPEELPPIFDWLSKHPLNQPLSHSVPGRIFNQRPCEIWSGLSKDFRRLANLAGLPSDLSIHCLRHTYAVELAKSGLPLKIIAQRMGHFGETTTLHYLQSLLT